MPDLKLKGNEVYIVDGDRTPFLKARSLGPFSASDLAVAAGKNLLNRQNFNPQDIEQVIIGCAMPGPDEANIARVIALRLGCGHKVPAFTVMRNCASGMQSLDTAAAEIASGRADLILAGGTEAMSHAPILLNQQMAKWLAEWMTARTWQNRINLIFKLRPSYLVPIIALMRGLTDPIVGLNMGQTAEELAYHFHITREAMDAFAYESHQRLAKAYDSGLMTEVNPIIDYKGTVYEIDDGLRKDTTIEKLAQLKPFFDKKYGMITAGNSSQVTDGACLLIMASKNAVKKYNLPVIGKIIDSQWAALDPAHMGLGPVFAATPIMKRHNLTPNDFDGWEINEAFAAQALACIAAWNDKEYCQKHFGVQKALGGPDLSKLNREGGAIAIGHPIGASGARIVLHLLKSLKQHNGKKGMAAICIGGGQGGAMYLEQTNEVGNE